MYNECETTSIHVYTLISFITVIQLQGVVSGGVEMLTAGLNTVSGLYTHIVYIVNVYLLSGVSSSMTVLFHCTHFISHSVLYIHTCSYLVLYIVGVPMYSLYFTFCIMNHILYST